MRQLKITRSITNRDSESLDKYLLDISRLPMITVEEEVDLTKKIRDGNNAALEKMVSANLRFVVSVAKQYQNQGIALTDLINEGNVGLIKAATRFDETRGFKFISYAVWWIRQSIMQAISEQSRVIRLPLNKLGVLNKIKKMQGILEQELERSPTSMEIADKLEINEQEVILTQSISGRHFSTDAFLPGNDDLTLHDIVSDPQNAKPDDALMAESLSIEIKRILCSLTDREKNVIVLHYGIGGGAALSISEISEKFELTGERVRQIKETAIRKLRSASRNARLVSFL
jgi:RNA polymerase primary sigma factor